MNTKITDKTKGLPADPLSTYASSYPDAPLEKRDQLETLCTLTQQLKSQINESQLQCKKLSRSIGEAKRNKQNIDDKKQAMQSLSQQLKQQKQQLDECQQNILSFFETTNKSTEKSIPQTPTSCIDSDEEQTPASAHRQPHIAVNLDKVTIKKLNTEHKQWNDYVSKNTDACIHHLSEWALLLKENYHHENHYFYAQDKNNNIVGILPLVRLKSRLFGDLLVSMPFFQRAGAIAEHPLIEQKLIEHANRVAADLEIEHIEYRDDIKREGMPAQTHKVNMVLALPDDSNRLWDGFSSKLRAQIKRPQRENPETQVGRQELLNDFYAVYARNMRDLGSPLHSKQFIASILQQFPDNSWLIVVRLKNKTVAAGLLLGYGDTMEIPLASTIRDVNHLSINMLLYWQVLQLAIEKKYQKFDFGRSTKNAGTYHFKKQWGAKAKPLYWHYWLKDGDELPALNPNNPKFALVIYLWKRLPVSISQWLGPYIIKNIP